jgi:hypothetical protein
MAVDERALPALSGRRLAAITLGAAAAAALILVGAVLPAEYGRDPTGIGAATGIARLWAPEEVRLAPAPASQPAAAPSRSYPTAFRSDVVEIPLAASGDPERGDELEYKVHLRKGGSYVFSWEAPDAPAEEFYTEFHGHTLEGDKAKMVVAEYRKEVGNKDNGVLTAPFDGIHGWYFQNQSVKPVTLRLRIAGFYDLIPAGQPGNELGFKAKEVR